jgi:hypothetical protein
MASIACTCLTDVGDRALLLGFAGAFRRSGLVALDIEDIEETKEGLRALIRHGKTDQEGKGALIAIVRGAAACPVAACRMHIEAASGAMSRLGPSQPHRLIFLFSKLVRLCKLRTLTLPLGGY